MRLMNLIAIEQHRFICERIELQNAMKKIMLLEEELTSTKQENNQLAGNRAFNRNIYFFSNLCIYLDELNNYHVQRRKSDTSTYDEPASNQFINLSEIQQLREELEATQSESHEHAEIFEHRFTEKVDEVEQLKTQLVAVKEQSQAFENKISQQNEQISNLESQLAATQCSDRKAENLDKLLAIRTDLIASMQAKEDLTAHQLEGAYRLAQEKTDECQKMLSSYLAKEEELNTNREQMEKIKEELRISQTSLANVEQRVAKLVEANGMLKLQFHKIMSYRDLKI